MPEKKTDPSGTLKDAIVSRLAVMQCEFGCGELPTVTLPRRLGSLFVCAKCWDAVCKDAMKSAKK